MKANRLGLSMIELLVALMVVAIIIPGVVTAVSSSIRYEKRVETSLKDSTDRIAFEERLKSIIEKAYLKGTAGDQTTFFTLSSSTESVDSAPDTLTFTTIGNTPSKPYMDSTDDFETLNTKFGPQGGLREISFSMSAVGDAGQHTGLFIRQQIPADTDTTQGGFEQVFNDSVTSIRFEAWDGEEWLSTWDTSTMTTPRLPAALSVYYRLEGNDEERLLVIRLPHSDVTPDNPVSATEGGTTP